MYLRIAVFLVLVACVQKESSRFVNINGKAQRILDLGAGGPVVVFISGFGDNLDSYGGVQRVLSGSTRTISYDRAGLGKSELTVKNRSLDTLVYELNEILKQENIPGPYVLVGHSYGGHIARYFAHAYPQKVGGMVLIDPTVEYMEDEFKRLKTTAEVKSYDSLYEHGRDPSWPEGVKREADYFRLNEKLMKSIHFPKNVPVTVLTAMNVPESTLAFLKGANKMKLDLHKRWQVDSPNIKHVIAQNSGHYIHYDETQLVIDEINAIIKPVATK